MTNTHTLSHSPCYSGELCRLQGLPLAANTISMGTAASGGRAGAPSKLHHLLSHGDLQWWETGLQCNETCPALQPPGLEGLEQQTHVTKSGLLQCCQDKRSLLPQVPGLTWTWVWAGEWLCSFP